MKSPSVAPGSPISVERLVVAIRVLPLYRKGDQFVTQCRGDSPPFLDSEVSGTIVSLRERFEAVRRREIHRLRGRLGNLSPDQEHVVESLSRAVVEKVLQAPVAMLLNAGASSQSPLVIEIVRKIFNLRR
jgi:glutamyl-tRNA reductase